MADERKPEQEATPKGEQPTGPPRPKPGWLVEALRRAALRRTSTTK